MLKTEEYARERLAGMKVNKKKGVYVIASKPFLLLKSPEQQKNAAGNFSEDSYCLT